MGVSAAAAYYRRGALHNRSNPGESARVPLDSTVATRLGLLSPRGGWSTVNCPSTLSVSCRERPPDARLKGRSGAGGLSESRPKATRGVIRGSHGKVRSPEDPETQRCLSRITPCLPGPAAWKQDSSLRQRHMSTPATRAQRFLTAAVVARFRGRLRFNASGARNPHHKMEWLSAKLGNGG